MNKHEQSITEAGLVEAKYKKYAALTKIHANCLWQKKVTDAIGTRYFINIYEYDFSEFEALRPLLFEVDEQFEVPFVGTINISFSVSLEDTISSIENKVDTLYRILGAKYYENEVLIANARAD